jgi:Peptidase M66
MSANVSLLVACVAAAACSDANPAAAPDVGTPVASAPAAPSPKPAVAPTIALSGLALFQSVKVTLMQDGAPIAANAPVIARRAAVFRAYVRTTGRPRETLRAELRLHATKDAGVTDRVYSASALVTASSKEEKAASLLSFDVPANALREDDEVTLTATGDAGTQLRYPETGAQAVGAVAGRTVNLRLVPVRYQAEGNDLLPELSDTDIAGYRTVLEELYPLARAEVSVRTEPLPWTNKLDASGDGWEEMLDAVGAARDADKADDEVFYMGLFRSRRSLGEYCRGGCVLGLAPVIGRAGESGLQFALSVGFGSNETPDTIAHELGHNLGRYHAPCGQVAGPDRKFPYDGGGIGAWGYSASSKEFFDPDEYTDMMGYCRPQWISDYTYNALFKRLGLVTDYATKSREPAPKPFGAAAFAANRGAAQAMVRVRVAQDGSLHWPSVSAVGSPTVQSAVADRAVDQRVAAAPTHADVGAATADRVQVQYTDIRGTVLRGVAAEYVPLDHLAGGYLLVPAPPADAVNMVVPSLATNTTLRVARAAELRTLRLPHQAPLLHPRAAR